MFVFVCGCFPHLLPWLVPSKPHTLEALVVPKITGQNKNGIFPLPPWLIFGEVVDVCVCLCVFLLLGLLIGAKQATQIGRIDGPQVCV